MLEPRLDIGHTHDQQMQDEAVDNAHGYCKSVLNSNNKTEHCCVGERGTVSAKYPLHPPV